MALLVRALALENANAILFYNSKNLLYNSNKLILEKHALSVRDPYFCLSSR